MESAGDDQRICRVPDISACDKYLLLVLLEPPHCLYAYTEQPVVKLSLS